MAKYKELEMKMNEVGLLYSYCHNWRVRLQSTLNTFSCHKSVILKCLFKKKSQTSKLFNSPNLSMIMTKFIHLETSGSCLETLKLCYPLAHHSTAVENFYKYRIYKWYHKVCVLKHLPSATRFLWISEDRKIAISNIKPH